MALNNSLGCLYVSKASDGQIARQFTRRPLAELPAGDVLIQVEASSLNYKDALAATGHPGVARSLPHVPGVDAAGVVVESSAKQFQPGDQVMVTGYDLGAGRWGGFAEYIRVPADWVVPLPAGLSLRESMIYGTAGLTAGLCLEAIALQGIEPSRGEVIVTGASGGVGSLSVALLAKAGYTVVAVTGKTAAHEFLSRLGAARVVGREVLDDQSRKPLLPTQWAAAVDTVGGNVLSTLIRSTGLGGCVAACGLVGGTDLNLSVYPFILRGVTLAGIDSAWCPMQRRLAIWRKLAGDWKIDRIDELATTVTLEHLEPYIVDILAGKVMGRVVVTTHDSPLTKPNV